MTNPTVDQAMKELREIRDLPSQLAELETMTIGALAEKYRALYGEPTRSRNKDYLKKRLRWRLQAEVDGGLSEGAVATIHALGDKLPERWRMRAQAHAMPGGTLAPPPPPQPLEPRDPRIPPVGTVVSRVFDGKRHEVTVAADGFEYEGTTYKTLSAIALHITGTRWNGFLFFNLKRPAAPATEAPQR